MAGRTSTILTPNSAQNLYTNDTGGAVVCTVTGVSTVTTENPPFSLKLSTDNAVALNFSQDVFTAPATYADNCISIDKPNGGYYPFYSPATGMGQIGDSSGVSYATTSSSNNYTQKYNMYLEPYMLTDPSEYGNPAGECRFAGFHTNNVYYIKDIRDNLANMPDYFNGASNYMQANADYTQGITYGNRTAVTDPHTGIWMSWHGNAYMSCGRYSTTEGSQQGNRSSDSFYYQRTGSSHDPYNYFNNTNNSPFASADGGVIVNNFMTPSNTALANVFIIPVRSIFPGGALPSAKFTDAPIDNTQWSNFINTTGDMACFFEVEANSFQWMKYNKKLDLYYFCFKGADEASSGIYSFTWQQMAFASNSTNAAYGLTGTGPWGESPFTFSGASTWKRVANYPLTDTTAEMSIPAKIGPNLWVSYNSSTGYYSTDLITWTSESNYFGPTLSEFNIVEQDAFSNNYYGSAGSAVIKQAKTGFDGILAGDLEKETPIGNYSRNGIVLSKGDSIYAENLSKTASISTNVMFAEI